MTGEGMLAMVVRVLLLEGPLAEMPLIESLLTEFL